jgi:pyridoxal phosphate enzyme (YggS family)
VTDITEHLSTIRERVRIAAQHAGKSADDVTIVAVSKQQPADAIQRAYHAGQRHFGESYVQEAERKIEALAELDIIWHFIGRIQANKTRFIAEHFHWVHTVDRERIARRLAEQRPYHAPPLNVMIQVNLEGEPQKGGVSAADVEPLARTIVSFDKLALRGLMTIPPAGLADDETAAHFGRLAALAADLAARGLPMDTLSMGMSGDYEIAIAAGSNCVRIGSAIFGERDG